MGVSKARTAPELEMYVEAEWKLIEYMLVRGVIKNEAEFIERFAPLYEMIAEGSVEVPIETLDHLTRKAREQIDQIRSHMRRKAMGDRIND